MSQKDIQGRRWCFTFYNDEDLEKLRGNPLSALVVAREEGTEEKREHLQGYVKFESNRRWEWWRKNFHCHPEGSGLNSAHWELANGPEWMCRRYIVDVEAYLRDSPNAHPKTQGEVLFDYGCEAMVDRTAPIDVRVVKMIVDGAKQSQIFREHPMFFFHNFRKIKDLSDCVASWRETGEEFKPSEYQPCRKRYKSASSAAAANVE